ncbi:hypothetical protein [Leucobacter luti]|uniref:hypothetical protein n=1 Tax=Leucobacter luti TaxID=340320 RepID=UPI003D01D8EA
MFNPVKRKTLGLLAGAAAVALTLTGGQAALADPPANTNPVIDGYGSDTTQHVMNGIATVLNEGGANRLASYDAGTGYVQSGESEPRAFVPRGNGSTQGKQILLAAIDNQVMTIGDRSSYIEVDGKRVPEKLQRDDAEYARSSSAGVWGTTGKLTYIPFAIDGVSAAVAEGESVLPADLPLGSEDDPKDALTLRNIYAGTVTSITVDGASHELTPLLPQKGSGSRAFWIDALGLTEAQVTGHASDVDADGLSVQENDGTHLKRPTDVMPYSIASFIAQKDADRISSAYGINMQNRNGSAELIKINGQPSLIGGRAMNTHFPVLRPVFNVVETNAINTEAPGYNKQLKELFVGADSAIFTAESKINAGSTVIADFGFGELEQNWEDPITKVLYSPGAVDKLADK